MPMRWPFMRILSAAKKSKKRSAQLLALSRSPTADSPIAFLLLAQHPMNQSADGEAGSAGAIVALIFIRPNRSSNV